MGMFVFGDVAFVDMPAAVATRWGFVIARIAQERTAIEVLFEPFLEFRREIAGVARQSEVIAAALAFLLVPLGQERRVMVVRPTAHLAGAVAQRTSHAHHGRNRLSDEGAFVGQLIQERGEFFLDFECNDIRFRRLASHEGSSITGGVDVLQCSVYVNFSQAAPLASAMVVGAVSVGMRNFTFPGCVLPPAFAIISASSTRFREVAMLRLRILACL